MELKRCPFCGKSVACCATLADIELMDDDWPDYDWAKEHYAVVCAYNADRRGVSIRGYATVEEAVKALNRRYGDEG